MTKNNQSKESVRYTLTRRAPDAKEVLLAGTFNNWNPKANPMQRTANGMWSVTLHLAPGRYEYKYVIDGQWLREAACEESARGCPHCVPNSLGSMNCVLNVT
jgi:1,4-alpha-glucan branching enzyme